MEQQWWAWINPLLSPSGWRGAAHFEVWRDFFMFCSKKARLCCLDHSLGFITQASRYTRQDIRSWNQPPWWFLAGGRRRHVLGPPWSADCFLRATTAGPKCCSVSLDSRHSWKTDRATLNLLTFFYILLKREKKKTLLITPNLLESIYLIAMICASSLHDAKFNWIVFVAAGWACEGLSKMKAAWHKTAGKWRRSRWKKT